MVGCDATQKQKQNVTRAEGAIKQNRLCVECTYGSCNSPFDQKSVPTGPERNKINAKDCDRSRGPLDPPIGAIEQRGGTAPPVNPGKVRRLLVYPPLPPLGAARSR